ncbi:MAG: type II toxin-antitoxin system MqsA family antitoxin [Clostridia bacterium]|nr:type II toxin-antitoxin system MqsA family antitoxin [Clostridia bacterium]
MKRLNYCYCDVCEKETDTYEKEIEDIFQVKDEKIQAKIKIRICKTCGNEVYDEKLEKENEIKVYNIYRERKGLLLPEEIKKIRMKYDMTQAAFARILGFGEKTITRYERGAIQDIAHDNLIRLMNDEKNMKKLYEKNKDFLTFKEREKIESKLYAITIIPFGTCYMPTRNPYNTKILQGA